MKNIKKQPDHVLRPKRGKNIYNGGIKYPIRPVTVKVKGM
jgi:hypothetical protein